MILNILAINQEKCQNGYDVLTYMQKIIKKTTISLLIILLFIFNGAFAKGDKIAVVYPDVREPYLSIFTSMVDGIRDTAGNEVKVLSIQKDMKLEELSKWKQENEIESIIALGNRSRKLVSELNIKHKVVGAITRPPDSGFNSGVLLTPDPGLIIDEMNRLVPGVKNLYVIYSEKRSGWYVEIAKQSARNKGINLLDFKSNSKKESLEKYKSVFNGELNPNSAIWLLQDPLSSDSRVILPMVLSSAWDRKIPVISNKAGHVERGALLALYPDHFEIGVRLANMLIQEISDKFVPFSEALNAANTRTADHLELKWSRKTKRSISLVFPQR